jgi:hypothetical protein
VEDTEIVSSRDTLIIVTNGDPAVFAAIRSTTSPT